MLNPHSNVLVTGITGLIGGELVRSLLRLGLGNIYCLIRPRGYSDVSERLLGRLRSSGETVTPEMQSRLRAVSGDVILPRFGLRDADFEKVIDRVDLVIHCASELSFIHDAHCRETNILGMHNLIDLVSRCRKQPTIVHLGTAASCGAVSHRCMSEADGSDPDNQHRNEYTRTKAVAERVLRDSGLPLLVLRPSITLSAGVPARRFARAIAWFLPLLREFDAVPMDPLSRVDIVPVSFVVDSIVGLLCKESLRYDCYNLSAGAEGATVCGPTMCFLDSFYDRPEPLKLFAPTEWTREMHRHYIGTPHRRKLYATLKYYLPFLNMDVVYDNARLRQELGAATPRVLPVEHYLGDLLDLINSDEPAADAVVSQP